MRGGCFFLGTDLLEWFERGSNTQTPPYLKAPETRAPSRAFLCAAGSTVEDGLVPFGLAPKAD